MGVVALENDRLDSFTEAAGVGNANDPGAREEQPLVSLLAAALELVTGQDHRSRGRRAGDRLEVAVFRKDDDVSAAHVLADVRRPRKLLCKLYTLTDYTYLFTHEFSGREEK